MAKNRKPAERTFEPREKFRLQFSDGRVREVVGEYVKGVEEFDPRAKDRFFYHRPLDGNGNFKALGFMISEVQTGLACLKKPEPTQHDAYRAFLKLVDTDPAYGSIKALLDKVDGDESNHLGPFDEPFDAPDDDDVDPTAQFIEVPEEELL